MDKNLIIEATKKYAKDKLDGEATGHDFLHISRVYIAAKHIAEKEGADLFIVEITALLHDIADWKFNDGNVDIGPKLAKKWLKSLDVPREDIDKVTKIIRTMSFKGGTTDSSQETIEGKIVQDADRLDALGAIGIARAFAYGGFKGREIYNPDIKPENFKSFEEYKNNKGTSINHFYEKLLLLKDLMNTETGKAMAEERHEFMVNFLKEFNKETVTREAVKREERREKREELKHLKDFIGRGVIEMEVSLEVGLKHQVEKMVSCQDTAKQYGSGDLEVYATPAMIALMENAATNCVKQKLPKGFTTVGIEINVKHIRATPVGVKVKAEAILEKVEGKKLFFKVEAYDDLGKIGEGINIRYLVNAEKFVGKTTRE